MFVTVRYGDEQEQIFNPNCRNEILLHCIKTHCHCKVDDVVELSDERGTIKNLRRYPGDYAKEYLKDRETLILLRVDKCSSSSVTDEIPTEKAVYTPLLSSLVSNPDFIDILNPARDDDAMSDTLSVKSSRRRSSAFDIDDLKTKTKTKSNLSNSSRKPQSSRRGHRPPLRKSANTS